MTNTLKTNRPVVVEMIDNGEGTTVSEELVEEFTLDFGESNYQYVSFPFSVRHVTHDSQTVWLMLEINFYLQGVWKSYAKIYFEQTRARVKVGDDFGSTYGSYGTLTEKNWYYFNAVMRGPTYRMDCNIFNDLSWPTHNLCGVMRDVSSNSYTADQLNIKVYRYFGNTDVDKGGKIYFMPFLAKFSNTLRYPVETMVFTEVAGWQYVMCNTSSKQISVYEEASEFFETREAQEDLIITLGGNVDDLIDDVDTLTESLSTAQEVIDALELRLTEAMVTNVAGTKADTTDIIQDIVDLGLEVADTLTTAAFTPAIETIFTTYLTESTISILADRVSNPALNAIIQGVKNIAEGDYR